MGKARVNPGRKRVRCTKQFRLEALARTGTGEVKRLQLRQMGAGE